MDELSPEMLTPEIINRYISHFHNVWDETRTYRINPIPDEGVKITAWCGEPDGDGGFAINQTKDEMGISVLVAQKWILHSELEKLILAPVTLTFDVSAKVQDKEDPAGTRYFFIGFYATIEKPAWQGHGHCCIKRIDGDFPPRPVCIEIAKRILAKKAKEYFPNTKITDDQLIIGIHDIFEFKNREDYDSFDQ